MNTETTDPTAAAAADDATGESQVAEQPPAPPAKNPVTRITRIVLTACALFLIWYLVADRLTPATGPVRRSAGSVA